MAVADVAIIGAGVIGSAIAYELARSTPLRIVVFETRIPGAGASGAAAGILSAGHGIAPGGELLDLRRRSAQLFAPLIEALKDETGRRVWYRSAAVMMVAADDAGFHLLKQQIERRQTQGFECGWLSRREVQEREPLLGDRVVGGAFYADDAQIDAQAFLQTLIAAARLRKVEFRLQSAVESLQDLGDRVRLRCNGAAFDAATAIVASGAWSSRVLENCGVRIPIRPARGEMFAVRAPHLQLRQAIVCGDLQLIPRPEGEVWIGSTNRYAGFDARVTADGLAYLRAGAEALVPALRWLPIERAWAGLRPCPTMRRPVIARLPGMPNVMLASGHHRSGVLLAPITARLVAEMIAGGLPTVALRPFSYKRH